MRDSKNIEEYFEKNLVSFTGKQSEGKSPLPIDYFKVLLGIDKNDNN